MIKSFFQVRKIFSDFRPDATVGVGGYSSFPVLRYAQQQGIPNFIHESNSFAGRANRILGKKATAVFVAAAGMDQFFPAGKIVLTGNPVRLDIAASVITREKGVLYFGLDPQRKTILSIGGSLGARNINEAIAAGINEFESYGLQLIWQTGKPFLEQAQEAASGKSNTWVGDFITAMEYAYAAADLVISRAGAMAIAELCVTGKPSVFVPYPFAAEDHQTVNAQMLVNAEAGIMIRDGEAIDRLVPTAIELASDEERQKKLKENIQKMAFSDADVRVATEILKVING